MVTRITGINSGMDIEGLVTQLMNAERIPLDKMKQNKQTLTWKSDAYREINKQLATFNTALNNLRFSSKWQTTKATSSDTSVATVTAGSGASASSHSLVVNSLATGAALKGKTVSGSTGPMTGAAAPASLQITNSNNALDVTFNGSRKTITLTPGTYSNADELAAELQSQLDAQFGSGQLKASVSADGKIGLQPLGTTSSFTELKVNSNGDGLANLGFSDGQSFAITPLTAANAPDLSITSANNQFSVTLDGSTKTITIPAKDTPYTANDLKDALQSQLDAAFGYGKVTAGVADGKLTLRPEGSLDSLPQLSVNAYGSSSGLQALGFTPGQSFKVSTSSKIGDIAGQFDIPLSAGGSFKVNGIDFSYTAEDTLTSIMSKVNSSAAGVRMTYDSVTDSFAIASKSTGAASKVEVSGDLMKALGFGSSNSSASGTDAEVVIDGTVSHRSSNSFTVDDISYTLLGADPNKTVTVNSTQDTDAIYNSIKSFVDAYNAAQTLIKKRLNETVDKNYPPLKDDERKEMSDDEIKLWEDKAKLGVLHNDSVLRSISSTLRQLTSATVDTLPTDYNSLFKIGITTTAYSSAGYDVTTSSNLQIDEDKLRAAIQKDPESVIRLFANQPGDSAAAKTGIAQQMYNQVNTSITQLVTKAGGLSTAQDAVTSTLGKQLHDLENDIDEFQDKLDTKEDNYYKRFSALEQAVAKGNSTLGWLQSAFGG
ncbi:flagellar filament capping protein FliD [Cohnella lubricantis]|uniref:Flagellar hook-associated protein 2 n=1 Tax=Cohnella lubricantis TaxID=2163172 RepID=A0A841TBC6_9BACL|nr:flagellar filament capping protein FliD [Cohnella lubricantis]MBB6677406.1 flagellar filament capping protein FliD [Cohnella lubricantis]MBP2118703.1 flagellar hook-associated protein 2 [Cohnella lubricantis]